MKKTWIFTVIGAAAALAAIYWAVQSGPVGTADSTDAAMRQPAPNFELTDLDGRPVSLEQLKGKVVIVDFWATNCPPCRLEIPGFIRLQKEFGPKGLQIVGLSLDEAPEVVRHYMAQMKINYPIAMTNPGVVKAFGPIDAIPTTFVIDRQGRIVSRHVGYVDSGTFQDEITPLL
jgi:peroxiredoxin